MKSVAVFAIATTIEGYVFALAGALNGLFLPRVTKLVVGPKLASAELLALLIKVGRFQFMLIGTIVGGFLLLGDSFIRLWVGTEFKDSYQVTVLLLLPAISDSNNGRCPDGFDCRRRHSAESDRKPDCR